MHINAANNMIAAQNETEPLSIHVYLQKLCICVSVHACACDCMEYFFRSSYNHGRNQ